MTIPRDTYNHMSDYAQIESPHPLEVTLTRKEINLILRLRQAAEQGRLVVVDPDAMVWYLCGQQERGK